MGLLQVIEEIRKLGGNTLPSTHATVFATCKNALSLVVPVQGPDGITVTARGLKRLTVLQGADIDMEDLDSAPNKKCS